MQDHQHIANFCFENNFIITTEITRVSEFDGPILRVRYLHPVSKKTWVVEDVGTNYDGSNTFYSIYSERIEA